MYVGHRVEEETGVREQNLADHLRNVRDLCQTFGKPLGLTYTCGLVGWLHDLGKYSDAFQSYLNSFSAENAKDAKHETVNHAFGGARVLEHYLEDKESGSSATVFILLGQLTENAIMAHHSSTGPYDYIKPTIETSKIVSNEKDSEKKLLKRLPFQSKKIEKIEELNISELESRFFSEFSEEKFKEYIQKAVKELEHIGLDFILDYQFYFLRFISSCLIDADHSDTAAFASQQSYVPIDTFKKLKKFELVNEQSTKKLAKKRVKNRQMQQLNESRQEMSDLSARAGDREPNIYKLSVPTGGGKTLSSLRFALHQAVQNHYERIVYIVPYTTIIEQNAKSLRKQLELEEDDFANVLEYHSTVDVETPSFDYYYAKDTWDAPIIMTTQVAYLNALFGSRSKNIRHMHRLISATLIFDEIQTIPLKTISMNNAFLTWLNKLKVSTSLLCTATQPALEQDTLEHGLTETQEIVQNLPEVEKQFARVRIQTHIKGEAPWSMGKLLEFIDEQLEHVHSILVVLNTKKAVLNAFQSFQEQHGDVLSYHLSTNMCAAHRKDKFAEITKSLDASRLGKKKVVVFSTRLIEAGVDLSFESAIRSLTGLDSVIQTAGRCNRNHETNLAVTHLIQLNGEEENLTNLSDIKSTGSITASIVATEKNDEELMSSDTIRKFFVEYFKKNEIGYGLDYPIKDQKGKMSLFAFSNKRDIEDKNQCVNEDATMAVLSQMSKIDPEKLSEIQLELTVAPRTVAENFEPIDQMTTPVIVPYLGGKDNELNGDQIIQKLLSSNVDFEEVSELLKKAQSYTVQVYGDPSKMSKFIGTTEKGVVFGRDFWYAESYKDDTGLDSKLNFYNF